ncbi:hypothetical protein H6503_05590 [Candidatus Woesearchaeota archaeon]|nr:hypothetical protein [Candidatus Woesearchaeota archaeon]
MLKKILSLFSKPEDIEIRLAEVRSKSDELMKKHIDDEIIPRFNQLGTEIRNILEQISEKSKVLENAELKNPNIPVKEKQYMVGNRESYLKHVDLLLKRLELPKGYSDIESKHSAFSELLEDFGKHTIRPRQILKHFFEHETDAIHNEISKLNKCFNNMKELVTNVDYNNHKTLIDSVNKISNSKKIKEQINKDIKDTEAVIVDKDKDMRNMKKELEESQNSETFKRYNTMLSEKSKIENEIASIRSEVISNFAKLDRALKKYERIAFEDAATVRDYLNDAFDAVTMDDGKGKSMLKNVLDKIESLDLKNKDKILEALQSMIDGDYIGKTKDRIVLMNKNLEIARDEIGKSDISEKIEGLKERISLAEKSLHDAKREIKDKKEELEKMTNEKFIEDIENSMGSILKRKVKVI